MAKEPTTGIAKRGSPSMEAHELTLITDISDPSFDRRVLNPVSDEAILNLAAVGFVQPVSVHPRGNTMIVVDGQQRTKRALIINAIVGRHDYDGPIQAVHDALKRLQLKDSLIGRRIIELCPQGVKVPITIHRGTEAHAYKAKVSANEFREGDPIAEKARKAQRLVQQGHDESGIAESFGVHVQTVKRWLAMDTEKVKTKKPRAKNSRPSFVRVAKVYESGAVNGETGLMLGWICGKVTREKLIEKFPKLEEVLA